MKNGVAFVNLLVAVGLCNAHVAVAAHAPADVVVTIVAVVVVVAAATAVVVVSHVCLLLLSLLYYLN